MKRSAYLPVTALLLAAVSLLAPCLALAASDPLQLETRRWDQPLSIGPGWWLGVKQIRSEDKAKHTIEPGAYIESGKFEGKGGVQWTVNGAYLRDCKFTGDLGFRFDVKDSAIEHCDMAKSGGWFVQWAGTRWRFTNCLVTKTFMRKKLPLNDHSVRATECTFVGIEMPDFPLRDDPSSYMGKNDLKFERCLFIGCDIPESLLAATVDCVFESCIFREALVKDPAKAKWETAKAPVAVTAYILGEAPPPALVHGKLSVTFAAASPANVAGCKLPFVRAGSRILVPWARQYAKSREIGVMEMPSSAIVVAAPAAVASATPAPAATPEPAAPKPPPPRIRPVTGTNSFFNLPDNPAKPPVTTPPANPPAPQPVSPPIATAPATTVPAAAKPLPIIDRPLRTIEDLVALLPVNAKLTEAGKLTAAGAAEAARLIEHSAIGKTVSFRITVDQTKPYREDGYAYAVVSPSMPLRIQANPILVKIEAKLRSSQSATVSRVPKGTTMMLRGVVGAVAVVGSESPPVLVLSLEDAQVQM